MEYGSLLFRKQVLCRVAISKMNVAGSLNKSWTFIVAPIFIWHVDRSFGRHLQAIDSLVVNFILGQNIKRVDLIGCMRMEGVCLTRWIFQIWI